MDSMWSGTGRRSTTPSSPTRRTPIESVAVFLDQVADAQAAQRDALAGFNPLLDQRGGTGLRRGGGRGDEVRDGPAVAGDHHGLPGFHLLQELGQAGTGVEVADGGHNGLRGSVRLRV